MLGTWQGASGRCLGYKCAPCQTVITSYVVKSIGHQYPSPKRRQSSVDVDSSSKAKRQSPNSDITIYENRHAEMSSIGMHHEFFTTRLRPQLGAARLDQVRTSNWCR
jgi:hypothetical protein